VEVPLSEVIEFLRAQGDTNIYVDKLALSSAKVGLDTPLTLSLQDVPIATVMELVADSLSDAIGVRYEDGIAVLGTLTRPTQTSEFKWGSNGSPASQLTMGRLAGTGDYEFVETPLEDVVDFLQATAKVNVYLNERTLRNAGCTADMAVSIDLKDVKHRTALRLILDSLDKSLYFSVVDGIVVITTEKRADEEFNPFGDGSYEESGEEEASVSEMNDDSPVEDEPPSGYSELAASASADIGASMNRPPVSGAEQLALLKVEVRSAKTKLDLIEASWRQGATGALELQEARSSLEIAEQKLAKAQREYSAQEKLLQLDLDMAATRLDAAEQELGDASQLADSAAISKAELRKFEFAVQQAKLTLERAKTLLDLHREAPLDEQP
jgi:hypothetical protein